MKIIHCADWHLASPMESRLSPEKAAVRRRELRESFRRMADFAEERGVCAVLICGDLFDEEKVAKSEKAFVIQEIREHGKVDFYCLAGNHDESLADGEDLPDNLLTFGDQWTKYSLGAVDVYGVEPKNGDFSPIYDALQTIDDRVNIVMLHGEISYALTEAPDDKIRLSALADKGIDYLALGHYHTYQSGELGSRGVWVYSGCPEGRGFDETGEKGFVLLDIAGNRVEHTFIPFACRTVCELTVDVSAGGDKYGIADTVAAAVAASVPSHDDAVRVILTGEVSPQDEVSVAEVEATLKDRYFAVSVKDKTSLKISPDLYAGEMSLRGEFLRAVAADGEMDEEEKREVIRIGIRALAGKGVSLE